MKLSYSDIAWNLLGILVVLLAKRGPSGDELRLPMPLLIVLSTLQIRRVVRGYLILQVDIALTLSLLRLGIV